MTWCGSLASIPRTIKGRLIIFAKGFQSLQIGEMILIYRRVVLRGIHSHFAIRYNLRYGCNFSINTLMLKPVPLVAVSNDGCKWLWW